MKKCKATLTGRHKWSWEALDGNTTGYRIVGSHYEVAERCKFCRIFKGTDIKIQMV